MLGGGLLLSGEKPLFQLLGGKTQIHTQELKARAGQRYAQKVLVNLYPLPHSFKAKPHPLPLKKARPAI